MTTTLPPVSGLGRRLSAHDLADQLAAQAVSLIDVGEPME